MAAAERELFWKDCGPGTFRYRSVHSHGCHWGRRGDMETCLPEKLAAGLAWEGEGGRQSTCFHGGGIARAPAPSPSFFKVRKRVSRRCIPGATLSRTQPSALQWRNSGTFPPPGCLVTRSSVTSSLRRGLGWGDTRGGVGR